MTRRPRNGRFIDRELWPRLVVAQDEVAAAQRTYADVLALVPEAEAALAYAKARLAEIEAEISVTLAA
ncbi:hypothetical protein SAMN05216573_102590 [Bradyrhizobium sp. Rc3b]|nr:hypothetical protein SAMN05216573_102590 [Bradyrhizobium sp. Rc3b]